MPRTSVHTTRIVPATNNEEVLGSNIQLQEAHGSSMRETEDFEKKQKTIKDFCNRLKRMTLWIKIPVLPPCHSNCVRTSVL